MRYWVTCDEEVFPALIYGFVWHLGFQKLSIKLSLELAGQTVYFFRLVVYFTKERVFCLAKIPGGYLS